MLGLGASLTSPYVLDSEYVNTHSLSLDGSGTGSDVDFFNTNTALQDKIRGNFSISCWVKLDDGQPTALSSYFAGAATGGNVVGLSVTNVGKISFTHFANTGAALQSTDAAVFDNGATDWTHVGVTVTKGTGASGSTGYKIYVNGSEVASSQLLGVTEVNHNNYTSSITLGFGALNAAVANNVAGGLDGLIDECAFFDDTLTDGEMSAIGGGGAPTDITGHDHLFLYYKLNNSTTDEVGNSNGSLAGQAAFSTTTP
jgi:hypothetical protein